MRNNYDSLDNCSASPIPFRRPPIKVGEYVVKDSFNDPHKFHFRRMPRAQRYTGRYGVFYYHPDAHWILVGYVGDKGEFLRPIELPEEYEKFLSLFITGKRVLQVQRCSWCGRVMETGNTDDVHQSETCRKNLRD